MKPVLTVVKIGGQIIDREGRLHIALNRFSELSGAKILVHGGGKIASQVLRQMGINTRMQNGRRITDADTLQVVQMVYGGTINKNIVALLQSKQCPAVGLSAVDGNIILARKRPVQEIDFGYAGDVVVVNPHTLLTLLQGRLIPVLAPLTHDGNGQILNTNADTVARAIASELVNYYNVRLIFVFEKSGVLINRQDSTSVIPLLTPALYQKYQQEQIIRDGMLPKIDMAFSALRSGVQCVRITKYDRIKTTSAGTVLSLKGE